MSLLLFYITVDLRLNALYIQSFFATLNSLSQRTRVWLHFLSSDLLMNLRIPADTFISFVKDKNRFSSMLNGFLYSTQAVSVNSWGPSPANSFVSSNTWVFLYPVPIILSTSVLFIWGFPWSLFLLNHGSQFHPPVFSLKMSSVEPLFATSAELLIKLAIVYWNSMSLQLWIFKTFFLQILSKTF